MNLIERQEAYRAIKERYNLRARQRDVLDASEKLNEMLEFALTAGVVVYANLSGPTSKCGPDGCLASPTTSVGPSAAIRTT